MFRSLFIASVALIVMGCSSAATPSPTASPSAAPTVVTVPATSPTAAPSAARTGSPATGATVVPFTSAAGDLSTAIPSAILPNCKPTTGAPGSGVLSGFNCTSSSGVTLAYFQFDSSADLRGAFAVDVADVAAPAGPAGGCGLGDWAGTWTVNFADGKKATGPDFGLLCYRSGTFDSAFIEQVNPTTNVVLILNLVANAPFTNVELAAARQTLYQWWQNNGTMQSVESRTP